VTDVQPHGNRELGDPIGIGRTAEVYAWGTERVVKLLRPGFDALGIAEATVADLVSDVVAAAPRFFGTARVEGRIGLIYDRVDGPSMLDRLTSRPWLVGGLATKFAELHAGMHGQDGVGLRRIKDAWRHAIEGDAGVLPRRAREASLERLASMPDGHAVCHGDMHPGNVLLTSRGPVVIDWLTAVAGPPAADVARTLYLTRDGAIPATIPAPQRMAIHVLRAAFARRYVAAYRQFARLDLEQVRLWRLPVLAVRMGEGIDEERAAILARIDTELAAG
jgi:aminoglycoside phosphotransferase (APT) family kinase protein